jgi:hypothetical protein
VDGLAVLSANPVRHKRDVGKGDDLGEHQQAADGRTSPSPGFHGSGIRGKCAPRHGPYLTPQIGRVKARASISEVS